MGNIYATTYLTAVADLCLQFTVLPMAFTMILGRHHGTGWAIAPLSIFGYALMVRYAWNIQNPLNLYIGVDYQQANVILNFMYIIFALGYSIGGWLWMGVIRGKDLFPLSNAFPSTLSRKGSDPVSLTIEEDETVVLDELEYVDGTETPTRTSPTRVPPRPRPSFMHLLVTLAWFLLVAGGQIAYDQVIIMVGNEWIAYVVVLLVNIGSGLLYLVYCHLNPDPAVFGHTHQSLAGHRETYMLSDTIQDRIVAQTRSAITWSIVPIILFTTVGYLAIGGARQITADVDPVWLTAVVFWGLWMALLVIVYFVTRNQFNPLKTVCKNQTKPIDDSGDYYKNVNSTIVNPSVMSRNISQALKSF